MSLASARRPWELAAGASLLAAIAVPVPVLALPAFLAVTLTFVALEGAPRRLVGIVGAPLAAGAFLRFLLVIAIPNIVAAGEKAAEEKAVSRLREIRWAEGQARELKWLDADADGSGEFVPLARLVEGQDPLLKPGLYLPTSTPGVVRTEAYDVILYLPRRGGGWTSDAAGADPVASSRRFVAYAWPIGERHGGARAFFIDQDEQICELRPSPFIGPGRVPPATAALDALVDGRCPPAGESGWHVWRAKKAPDLKKGVGGAPPVDLQN